MMGNLARGALLSKCHLNSKLRDLNRNYDFEQSEILLIKMILYTTTHILQMQVEKWNM